MVLLVLVVGLLQLSPFATSATRRLIGLVPLNEGYRLGAGRVSGTWFGWLALDDVESLANRELAHVDHVKATYRIGELRLCDHREVER